MQLMALSCVDVVVLFAEDTPKELIYSLKPNILVKGGDYTDKEVVGGDFVRSLGGRVDNRFITRSFYNEDSELCTFTKKGNHDI